jgi:peptide/nickel transport system substrate-binding protein
MNISTSLAGPAQATLSPRPVKGGIVTWACRVGFPPTAIFPFTPPERFGVRNINEFQMLMYRPLYWLGQEGKPGVNYGLSLAEPPQWQDGRTVTVTLKPWKWSNGETICADNVMFWVNMMMVKGSRFGGSGPGTFPDNLTSYEKVAEDKVRFTFDRVYSRTWVLMNQLTLITPMPKAWDRAADDVPANASASLADIPAVYDYLVAQNGEWTEETNENRERWAASPVWSVVNGPWRLKSYTLAGTVTLVPNERYSGPGQPYLDEFRQVPISHDKEMYRLLEAGPDGPDAVQVGYLPAGLLTGSAAQRTAAGSDPIAESYRILPLNAYCIRLMLINFENPATSGRMLKQAYVRQALQYSLDQDSAIREIFQGYGHRASGPIPLVPDSDYVSPRQRNSPMLFDVERARTLLADHGWDVSTTPAVCMRPGAGPGCAGPGIAVGDKISFSLRYASGDVALDRLVRQLASDAAKAGIELRLEMVAGNTLLSEDHAKPDEPTRWELNTWNGGWAYYGRPTGEAVFKTGGGANYGRYSDGRADELIGRTLVSDDNGALYAYQDYVAEQAPVIFMPGFPVRLLEVAKNLHGMDPVNPYGLINPEQWYYTKE